MYIPGNHSKVNVILPKKSSENTTWENNESDTSPYQPRLLSFATVVKIKFGNHPKLSYIS
jgi:hypothetical protein